MDLFYGYQEYAEFVHLQQIKFFEFNYFRHELELVGLESYFEEQQ